MHQDGRKRIDDRIVNIAQPYVRPIKRGKAGKNTEFGAKLKRVPLKKLQKKQKRIKFG